MPLQIRGLVQKGSSKFSVRTRAAAHVGDPAMTPLPPAMTITGVIAGTLTFATPMQGIIEQGSSIIRADGRGVARVGDTVISFFPPLIPFVGMISGAPLSVPVAIVGPARGFIQAGAPVRFA